MFTEIEPSVFVDLDATGNEAQRIVMKPREGMVMTLSADYLPAWILEAEAKELIEAQNQEVTVG
jgi:hypothetical protein